MKRTDISRLQKNKAIFLKLGFIIALASVIAAFRWETYDALAQNYKTVPLDDSLQEIEVLRTLQEKQQQLPPPSIEVSEVILQEETPEFIEELVPEETPVLRMPEVSATEMPAVIREVPPPKPPPPAPKSTKIEPDEIFLIAEKMPVFGDCDTPSISKEERQLCSDMAVLKYLSSQIKYPSLARETGIEGTVIVRFTIGKEGQIEDAKVLKDVGGGLGKEALRVVEKMPEWQPGSQRGRNVKVQMTLPVKFKLQ